MIVESPIELMFLNGLRPHLAEGIDVLTQVEVETIRGIFRVDFMIRSPRGTVIVVECDGKDYHEFLRDSFRDALILGTKTVNVIYRIGGHDLHRHWYDHLYWLYKYHPELFSEQGIQNICAGAKMEKIWEAHFPFKPCSERREHWRKEYPPEGSGETAFDTVYDVSEFNVRLGVNEFGLKPFGVDLYKRVRERPEMTFDEVVAEFREENKDRYRYGCA